MRIIFLLICFLMTTAAVQKPEFEESLVGILRQPHQMAVQEIKALGPQAYVKLGEISFNSKWPMQTRWKAFMALTQAQGKKSINEIKKALTSTEWFMRSAGLTTLQKIDPIAVKKWAFQKLQQDPALLVRMKAVEVLAEDKSAKVVELFWRSLNSSQNLHKNKSLWIRGDIAKILSRQPRGKDLPRWVSLLHDPDNQLQLIASRAIGELKKGPALEPNKAVSYWRQKYPKKSL